MKASEVLQASIDDIETGKWICGDLHIKDYEGKSPNPKEMGCAVGLVSLNSGDTKTIKITERDLPWMPNHTPESVDQLSVGREKGSSSGASATISKEGIKVGDHYEVARYPKQSSPQETKDAIKYLDETVPEDYRYPSYNSGLKGKIDNVVNFNDSYCVGPKDAKKWFEAARDRAIADGN